ncbi:Endo alpha-1,4 polygalactosaminidase, putative [Penicillium digitatum]|uniref:alpha-galactosidase n=3 Tax=Penicillium digitatum TaxID=36651 RepID=K9GCB5_PEND2|nr:Endo alpha-1,4 polygalactosaminidase, putative [Penicillium digitatum Pd1]EKV12498.1 Endo alpha-1,4 polygalactosaminidase, putative [Penicillium digitatum PHI26]EKV16495.1 Endo alpha-1,4 polygalactosaminidase, putative [Penicillium digitatum Pd1]QQK42649.1 Endo alpha-1,4 polygalactosaminidase, putative [Penicillium digitatum]
MGRQVLGTKTKLLASCVVGLLLLLAIGMGSQAELGAGHSQRKRFKRDQTSTPSTTIWQPAVGVKWQIQLVNPVEDTTVDADIWDIDLFDNSAETITTLQNKGRKVICYFSSGTYEDWRPDRNKFQSTDFGNNLDDWPGERWLNIKSSHVRAIMSARLDLAQQKGCDGVDPDNIDGYQNENGLGLTEADSIEFLGFLAEESHSRGMSIGLKNGGDLIGSVIEKMQWSVNEQCVEYNECEIYAAFTEVNKPVFHIEYSGETFESGGAADTLDSATETTTKSKATGTSITTATVAVTVNPASTSASASATSTAADAIKHDSIDCNTATDEEDAEDEEDSMKGEASSDLRARAVLSSKVKTSACNAENAGKFSTVIKNVNLDAWVEYC